MALEIVDLRPRMPNYSAYKGWQRPGPVVGIAVHHSGYATVDPATGAPNVTPRQIFDYHVNTLGWPHGGYNYIIGSDGTIYYVLDERIPAYHCGLSEPDKVKEPQKWQRWASLENGQYFNNHYIAICLLGWFSRDRVVESNGARTRIPDINTVPPEAQWKALVELIRDIRNRYRISIEKIQGHRELRAAVSFDTTDCPGSELDMEELRRSVSAGEDQATAPPSVPFVRNRPLVGLRACGDRILTPDECEITRQAGVESVKTLSLFDDEVYARLRSINPRMEFIVRLYKHMPRGSVPSPQQFADEFQPIIERLHARFGILKFEIHNEPNHPTGLEGWGQTEEDARSFQEWYVAVFTILKQRNPWALFGYPGLAVPYNDLEWLDWNREAIEMSDWLGCHVYWQTPPHAPFTFRDDFWGGRFKAYHAKYPHKLIEITEFGHSNGHHHPRLSEEEMAEQYVWWLTAIQQFPYIGSAHACLVTSPVPTWVDQRLPRAGSGSERGVHVAQAIRERVVRLPLPPDWLGILRGFEVSGRVSAGNQVELVGTVVNGGRLPWRCRGLSQTTLVAWWTDTNGEQIGERRSFALPTDMAPSDEVPMRLAVESPDRAGEYLLCLDLHHSGFDQWLSVLGPGSSLVQGVRVHEPSPPWNAEWVAHRLPERLHAGRQIAATVVIRNEGSRVWPGSGSPSERVHLGYTWLTPDGQGLSLEGRAPLPRDVAPGEQVEIDDIPIQLPSEAGRYQLRFDLIDEAAGWFGEQGSTPLTVEATVQPAPPALAFDWLLVEAERVMIAGQPAPVTVKVRNTGSEPWLAVAPDGSGETRFGYRWSRPDGSEVEAVEQVSRAPLPHDVAPGEVVTIRDLPVVPPDIPGHYCLEIGLVREDVSWFPDPVPNAGRLLVEVSPPPAGHDRGVQQEQPAISMAGRSPAYAVEYLWHTVPARLAPGQLVTVTLQVRNRGGRTWRAVGDTSVALVYRWAKAEEPDAVLGGAAVSLPHDVLPDAVVTFAGITLHAPATPGHYRLRWELLEEGAAWFHDPNLSSLELPVEIAPQVRAASPAGAGSARHLPPRESTPGDQSASVTSVIDPAESGLNARAGWLVSALAAEQGLSWSAMASHNPGDAPLALDPDPSAFWSSVVSQYPGMFFQVDLGRPTAIDSVGILSPGRGFAAGYRIRVSVDGLTWTTVARCSPNRGDIHATFNPMMVRYLRIEQTGKSSNHTPWLISEIRIHENPLWRADASHHREQIHLAFDNREETAWTTGAPQSRGMWVTLDMARQEEVTGFVLKSRWHEEYPRGLLLEISPDGSEWERILEVDDNRGDLDIDFPRPFKGRFLALLQTSESPWYAWTISELTVKRRR